MNLVALGVTFGAIFVVELPDKTFLATLVLATRYRPALVWIGVGLAFAVQTTVAVAVGAVATLLPQLVVQIVSAVMFLLGAILLLREARNHRAASLEEEGEEYAARARPAHGVRAVAASFLVLLAAEWGDLSQLLTITLVARYHEPLSVFVGALAALLTVSGLAVLLGTALLRRVQLYKLFYAGAAVCLLLEAVTLWEIAR